MNKFEMSEEELRDLFFEEEIDNALLFECTPWEDDGKYSYCKMIFQLKDAETGIATLPFYMTGVFRSGSYFSDYDYYFDGKVYEAEQVEVTKQEWRIKKDD